MERKGWASQAVMRPAGLAVLCLSTALGCTKTAARHDSAAASSPVYGDTAVIGSAGGTLITKQPRRTIRLDVPAGALGEPTQITVKEAEEPMEGALGRAFHLEPSGLKFAKPIQVKLAYDAGAHPLVLDRKLRLATYQGASWQVLPDVVAGQGDVGGEVQHFSLFAVVEQETGRVYRTHGTGEHFSAGDVVMETSTTIQLDALVVWDTAVMFQLQVPEPKDVAIQFTGLRPNAALFVYGVDQSAPLDLLVDDTGRASFARHIDSRYRATVQATHSTIVIDGGLPGGGDCEGKQVGTWDASTRTCHVNKDIGETVRISGGLHNGPTVIVDCSSGVLNHKINPADPQLALDIESRAVVQHCGISAPFAYSVLCGEPCRLTNNAVADGVSFWWEADRFWITGNNITVSTDGSTDNGWRAIDIPVAAFPEGGTATISGNTIHAPAGINLGEAGFSGEISDNQIDAKYYGIDGVWGSDGLRILRNEIHGIGSRDVGQWLDFSSGVNFPTADTESA
jgi:hypothetical protein